MLYICLLVILFLSYAGKFRGTVSLLLLVKDLPGIVNVLVVLTSKRRRLAWLLCFLYLKSGIKVVKWIFKFLSTVQATSEKASHPIFAPTNRKARSGQCLFPLARNNSHEIPADQLDGRAWYFARIFEIFSDWVSYPNISRSLLESVIPNISC